MNVRASVRKTTIRPVETHQPSETEFGMQTFQAETMTPRTSPAEQRRPVTVPPPHAGSAKSLKKQHASLQARAADLESARQAAARRRAEFGVSLDTIGDDATLDLAGSASEIRGDLVRLLRQELSLRSDLAGYLADWHESGRERVAVLREELEAARDDVLKRLIQAGYDDPSKHKLSLGRVMPGYVNLHPKTVAATVALRTQQGILTTGPTVASNAIELAEVRRLLQRLAAGLSEF